MATAARPRSASASGVPIASSRLSTSESMRLMKKLATAFTFATSPPVARRRSSPDWYASKIRFIWPSEKSSVMFTLMPSAMHCSNAAAPSGVPGILMSALSRATAAFRRRAAATVPSTSAASAGETSRLTNPSSPREASNTGRRMSHAARTSPIASCS